MNRKKQAFSNVVSFAILILLLLFLFSFFVGLSNDKQNEALDSITRLEAQRTLYEFKAELLPVMQQPNSSVVYDSQLAASSVELKVNQTVISAIREGDNQFFRLTTSTYGIPFCTSKRFSARADVNVSYNGSCLSVSTP